MKRAGKRPELTDEVVRFQAEIQRLAFDAVRAVIEQELDRRHAKAKPARRPTRTRAPQLELELAAVPVRQLALALAGQPAAQVAAPTEAPPGAAPSEDSVAPAAATSAPPPVSPTGPRKRVAWTRETITEELATWMLSGTTIDAQFMTRHGPRGLVAAIRRVFGRFDAAMNVAALHVSKLYPDGPPDRRVTALAAQS